MKPAFFNTVLAATVIVGIARASALEPLLTTAPSQLNRHPLELDNQSARQPITLSISNRTPRKWRFSNSERRPFELVRIGGGRDATMLARPTDFPYLAPGGRAIAKRYCKLTRYEKWLEVILTDGTGGITSFEVTPGDYKLCVSDQATLTGPPF